ncbi:MAG: leucine-rich repeat protein, partial [Spirochaetales bacterium]|nr:leucine-rich repeat protein [Spirochaetales bacterium]
SLTEVVIPGSVTAIGESAFKFCTKLAAITIPGSVTSIGAEAFYGCDSLATVYFSGSRENWEKLGVELLETTKVVFI